MPRFIVKLGDGFLLEWSTVVDAPLHFGLRVDAFRRYYQAEHGEPVDEARIERALASGTSSRGGDSAEGYNRAGPGETELTPEQLVDVWCFSEDAREFQRAWEEDE